MIIEFISPNRLNPMKNTTQALNWVGGKAGNNGSKATLTDPFNRALERNNGKKELSPQDAATFRAYLIQRSQALQLLHRENLKSSGLCSITSLTFDVVKVNHNFLPLM